MRRLEQAFRHARQEGRAALMPYLAAGFPDLETSARLVETVAAQGADIIELGIPYSDPVADGPTIQRATQKALEQGVRTSQVMELIREVRRSSQVPMVLMVYYNCVYRWGEEAFAEAAREAGADGLIVPDLPPEEAGSLLAAADARDLALVPFLAPTSTPRRIALVGSVARGFAYCVSVTGVTGARRELPPRLADFLQRVRPQVPVPLAVGFGVSTPEQVRVLASLADGVIVGSALIDRIAAAAGEGALAAAAAYVRQLREALDGAPAA